MIDVKVKVTKDVEAHLVQYDNLSDFATCVERNKYADAYDPGNSWAGGTKHDFQQGCARGSTVYGNQAAKMVDEFTNLTIKDYDRSLEWNCVSGAMDHQAAMSGDPMCMYGPTLEKTTSAPIVVYMDLWISSTIPAEHIEMRGIAVLALVQALSMFRPVQLKIVCGMMHSPSKTNVIQVVPVPTSPMDLARASWMIASPLVPRRGLYQMMHGIAKDATLCGGPMLAGGALQKWQEHQLGQWLADREGIEEVVFLPMMYGNTSNKWNSEKKALAWVKAQVARFVEK